MPWRGLVWFKPVAQGFFAAKGLGTTNYPKAVSAEFAMCERRRKQFCTTEMAFQFVPRKHRVRR